MYSSRYFSPYCIFPVNVDMFRNVALPARNDADMKAIADVLIPGKTGLSEREQASLFDYLDWLTAQRRSFECRKQLYARAETDLDIKLAKRGGWLIANGSILPAAEFSERTGIAQERLAEKVRERSLFKMPPWVAHVSTDDYYPAIFADKRYNPTFLEATSQALGAANGIRKYRFFTTRHLELDNKTPLDLLVGGNLARILFVARRFRLLAPAGTGPK